MAPSPEGGFRIRETPLTVAGLIEELQAYAPDAEIGSAQISLRSGSRASVFDYSKRRWMAALAEQRAADQA